MTHRPIRLYRGGLSGTIWATCDYTVSRDRDGIEQPLEVNSKTDVTADFENLRTTAPATVPQVGCAAVLWDAQHRLLSLHRLSPHGRGTYSIPGGHQEIHETPEQTAVREMKEETGLDVRATGRLGVTDTLFDSGLRYSTWFINVVLNQPHALRDERTLEGRYLTGSPAPQSLEPDKHDEIAFRYLDDLLALPLFTPLAQFLASQISPATASRGAR